MSERPATGTGARRRRAAPPAGVAPLSPQRKWRAILVATLVLVPAFWSMLAGLVAGASDDPDAPNAAAALAFGLALIPFVFIVLAFMSEHPAPAGAVVRAMVLALLVVGIPVSALAGDAVTGIVAGVGAGGIVALRMDYDETVRARVLAVVFASVYTFVLVRVAGGLVLLPAPIFPFTALGIADHLSERNRQRDRSTS